MIFNINWHDASKELPDRSCAVLVITDNGYDYYISTVMYSSKFRAFNALDFDKDDEYFYKRDEVKYWAYKDDLRTLIQTLNGGKIPNYD